MLDEKRLEEILATLEHVRVAVLGDFCLDIYWTLDPTAGEKSVETGLTTQPVRTQNYSLGGAGNVVANLGALGVGTIRCFGAVGTDPFGVCLTTLLEKLGADCEGLVICRDAESWQTLAYCKPHVGADELARIDMGNFNALADSEAEAILQCLESSLPDLDIVIVNQQVLSGVHTPFLRQRLRKIMQDNPGTVFLYDGRHHADSYPDAWLKVNDCEAVRLCGLRREPGELVLRDEAEAAARTLFARNGKPVFVTRGARGCVALDETAARRVPGLETRGAIDPVGAGDSFLAGLSSAIAAGATTDEAAEIGNFVARVTVTKLRQTGTATQAEVRSVAAPPIYVHEPELAEDPRRAVHWNGTRIEIIGNPPTNLQIKYAIFDHDGTISTLRQGWEEVMEPMMIRAVLGDQFEHADESLYHKTATRVRRHIDQTTGVQTLVQMQGLLEIVREFGIVPPERMLDTHGYKDIYNRALMRRVRERMARLKSGELTREDFAVKNAIPFLEALNDASIQCFLASGTDQDDVRAEAEAMGYAPLFADRIYGAVGDVSKEAKRMVLDRILANVGDPGKLVTFGDGPVEIRETRRRGALAVGVASDEVHRFGLNPAKRTRLVRAGAQVIVPDFSQMASLLDVLGIRGAHS